VTGLEKKRAETQGRCSSFRKSFRNPDKHLKISQVTKNYQKLMVLELVNIIMGFTTY
jgi:hypothetical protein